MSKDCVFCRILSGDLPSHRIYEDEWTYAFLDIFPVNEGHVLVITRNHYENIFEATPESLVAVTGTVATIAEAIRQVFNPDGLTVAQLNGEAAGQTVFHYHTHLIPRRQGDPMDLHSRSQGQADKLAATAAKISAALN